MKAGTTSLYHYLGSHPQVYLPKTKELDYFTAELNWGRGLPWYERQFASAPHGLPAIGEASTSYTKYPRFTGVPERVANTLPGVRLIYVVRHPIERMYSHYRHNVTLGEETRSFNEAVLKNRSYTDYSLYALQVRQYLERFPQEQLLIITSENLREARQQTIQTVCEFLGIDKEQNLPTLHQEFYTTAARPTYGLVVRSFRRGLKTAFPSRSHLWRGHFLPGIVKESLGRRRIPEQAAGQVALSDATKEQVEELLREDVRRLRNYMADGFDGWGIA